MNVTLLLVQGRPAGKKLVFPPGDYLFGRGVECHVRPNTEWVSRQHCLLRVTQDTAFVRDLGSRNGTLINGELLTQDRPLVEGDNLQIGPLVFEVHCQPGEVLPPLPQRERATGVFSGDKTVPETEKTSPYDALPEVNLNKTAPPPSLPREEIPAKQ